MWFKRKVKYNNTVEAINLLEAEVNKRRTWNYEKLARWVESGRTEHYEIKGSSGIDYQLEVYVRWDDKKTRTIRLIGSIDGGDISAYRPINSDFIKAPDNTFIGE